MKEIIALSQKELSRARILALVAEGHVSLVEAESVREVSKAAIQIYRMGLRLEARPQGAVWLPAIFELKSDVRLLGIRARKHNIHRV